jgi:hypothetical protein
VFDAFAERMPLLGHYRVGDPRVMDWQIRWAVELEHALHDGYFRRAAPYARG